MNTVICLSYHGAGFHGCPDVPGLRTVLGELRAACERFGQPPLAMDCFSRTDAGVHARGNVVLLDLPRRTGPGSLLAALDRHLPADLRPVAVADLVQVPRVVSKVYAYELDLSPCGDPLRAPFAWRPGRLDLTLLVTLAAEISGTHDFAAFRRRGETRASLVRHIERAQWRVHERGAAFEVEGSGFGYHLVRGLVGAMVRVARGGVSPQVWARALAGEEHDLARETAPAYGLCLERLKLEPEPAWVRTIRPG